MKFCASHWLELRAAISACGLDGLIAKNGEQAIKQLASELEGGPTRSNFDPLMQAHNAIVSNAMDHAGLAIMTQNEDGSDRCPLCFLIAQCQCADKGTPACAYAKWIGYASRDALALATQLGLVGAA